MASDYSIRICRSAVLALDRRHQFLKEDANFLILTSLRGRKVLRLCTINPRTTEDDIRDTIHQLEHFGRVACAGNRIL